MTIADLVAHLRRWLSDPMVQPKAFYAQMALVNHIRNQA